MALNAYINEFPSNRTLKEKCSICNNYFKDEFFSMISEGPIGARIKENRMCSKRCMNMMNIKYNKEMYGKNNSKHSNSDM
jgi:hypothetical protein